MSVDFTPVHDAGAQGPRRLIRHSATYALGGLAYKGVALLTVPLLARLLSPAQLGLLDLAAVLASLGGLIIGLGSEQSVAWLEPRARSQGGLWAASLLLLSLTGAVLVSAVVAMRDGMSQLVTGTPAHADVVAAAACYAVGLALSAAALNAVRLRGSPRRYAVVSFLIVSAEMAAALSIAWLVADPVAFMVAGWAVASAALAVITLWRHLPRLERPSIATLRKLVQFGAPLVPAAVAWIIGDAVIRAVLGRSTGLVALGEYGIAYRIASILGLAVSGFVVAWQPLVFRASAAAATRHAVQTAPLVMLALASGAIAIGLMAPEIVSVIAGVAYAEARGAVLGLAGGFAALGLFALFGTLLASRGSTRPIAVLALLGVAVQVAAVESLVRSFGVTGAALASFVGYALAAIVAAVWAGARTGEQWTALWLAAALSAGAGAVAILTAESALAVRVGVLLILVVLLGTVGIAIRRSQVVASP
jgi:O-antigen/teichoic acid export membrane protein